MLVSMGGKVDSNDGTNKYSKLVSSSANIAAFSSKVLTFLSKYGFDGLDVNWQYPSSPADQSGFSNLLTALRSALNPRGYLLSAAVSYNPGIIDSGNHAIHLKQKDAVYQAI